MAAGGLRLLAVQGTVLEQVEGEESDMTTWNHISAR